MPATTILAALLLSSCGSRQPATDESLVEKVCTHAMHIASRDEIGEFTMSQCREELFKRADKLRGGFHGWAHCLLGVDSIPEAKALCRERDFLQGN
ncbi:MAG: hypothetical protein JKY56_04240 [Kofleriaceae bacterium]|nr:hypothetical protein [Kofleriaceae bacterium]